MHTIYNGFISVARKIQICPPPQPNLNSWLRRYDARKIQFWLLRHWYFNLGKSQQIQIPMYIISIYIYINIWIQKIYINIWIQKNKYIYIYIYIRMRLVARTPPPPGYEVRPSLRLLLRRRMQYAVCDFEI